MSDRLMMIGFGVVMVLIGWLLLKSHSNNRGRRFTKNCPTCGKKIEVDASICPYCWTKQSTIGMLGKSGFAKDAHHTKLLAGLLLIFVGVVLVGTALGLIQL